MNIVVESSEDRFASNVFEQIASACIQLGHDVVRWHGPGKSPYDPPPLPLAEVGFVWNGYDPRYDGVISTGKRNKTKLFFVERGWFEPDGFQLDSEGTHAMASWSNDMAFPFGGDNLLPRTGKLVVFGQPENCVQLQRFSPWFGNSKDWLKFMHRNSVLPIRFVLHPSLAKVGPLTEALKSNGHEVVTYNGNPIHLTENACAFATINAPEAAWAIRESIPLLCYGHAPYRQDGVTYCLDSGKRVTEHVTERISNGDTRPLLVNRYKVMMDYLTHNEWQPKHLPDRLEKVLDSCGLCTS